MTSSSFSSNALSVLLLWSVSAWSASTPVQVEIPTRAFGKRAVPPIHGTLWLALDKTAERRAVVLIAPPTVDAATWQSTAEIISKAGFDVVALEPRKNEQQYQRALLEDMQSGVLFMKADPRVRAATAVVIGSEAAANVAAHYAAASKQMSLVLGALVLINPDKVINGITLFDALEKIRGIPVLLLSSKPAIVQAKNTCPTVCSSELSKETGRGIVARTTVLKFLKLLVRPHG